MTERDEIYSVVYPQGYDPRRLPAWYESFVPKRLDPVANATVSDGAAAGVSGHDDRQDHAAGADTERTEGEPERLSLDVDPFEANVMRLFNEARALMLRKHRDYGPKNISEAPGGPLNGLLVRMHDKSARLNNLVYNRGGKADVDESIEDTLMDLANYAIIAILVRRGQWPGTDVTK